MVIVLIILSKSFYGVSVEKMKAVIFDEPQIRKLI